MSAFVVSNTHINAIVNFTLVASPAFKLHGYSFQDEYREWPSPEQLGQILLDENVRSVNARYGEHDEPDTFVFTRTLKPISAVAMLSALDCLEYQSCESYDWVDTLAHCLVEVMRSWTIHRLPGYAEAAWEIRDEPTSETKTPIVSRALNCLFTEDEPASDVVAEQAVIAAKIEAPTHIGGNVFHQAASDNIVGPSGMIFYPRSGSIVPWLSAVESQLLDTLCNTFCYSLDWDRVLAAVEEHKANGVEEARKRNTNKLIIKHWNE